MTRDRFMPPLNKQIVDEAAEWFVEINEGDADRETRERFHAWLALSPEHVRTYLQIVPIWEQGAKLESSASSDPAALIAWARATDNVVPLAGAERPNVNAAESALRERGESVLAATSAGAASMRASERVGRFRRSRVNKTAIAAGAAVIVFAMAVVWGVTVRGVYDTGIGEQRIIALEDGSRIELNARSRLKVRFSAQQRSIELVRGQALFQVAKDSARPFIVRSGDTSVRALGTQFDVYRKSGGTVVTVVDGKVAVAPWASAHSIRMAGDTGEPVGADAHTVTLGAGEQVVVSADAVPRPRRADVTVATAWTQQQLVFFGTPLTEVADEFNRYNQRQLLVRDARLSSFLVSGTFSSTDPASLIRFLRAQPGLRVAETGPTIEIATAGVPRAGS